MISYNHKKKTLDWSKIPAIKLIFRILMALLLISVSRWLIYLFNTAFFHHLTLEQALRLYVVGMRFDLVVIAYANALMILFYCLPFKFICNRVLQRLLSIYYVIVNAAVILLNMVDVVYFRHFGQQMTAEVLKGGYRAIEGLGVIVDQLVVDYWYVLVLTALFVMVLVVVGERTRLDSSGPSQEEGHSWALVQWVSLLVFAVATPIAARGGIQQETVDKSTALRYADSQNMPIVLNTPFNLMRGSDVNAKEHHYEGLEDVDFSPIHFSGATNRFISDSLCSSPNLVFIVLKGLGQEMTGYYNPDQRYPLTTFLDSLLAQSLTFNGRANGRRSVEVLPALFSGIPPLNNDPTVTVETGLVGHLWTTLMRQGYKTILLRSNNAAATIDTLEQPFAAVVYPSYTPKHIALPEESYLWSNDEKAVYYTDRALHDFFEEASAKPWFDSTLFVVTSDCSNDEHFLPEYSNIWGMYAIPIAFHMPSHIEPLRCDELAQQTDLNISIPAALGINDTVFSFGRNLFDTLTKPSFITYINLTYQFSDGQYLIQSDGNNTIGVFNIRRDRQLDDNLIDRIQCEDIAIIMKKIIQEYNNYYN